MKVQKLDGRMRKGLGLAAGLVVLLGAGTAFAAPQPDLRVTYVAPPTPAVYASAAYGVRVANIGTKDAQSVTLTIQLPATNTSPQVYVMGTLGVFDPVCVRGANGTAAGTRLVCALGLVKKGTSKTLNVNLALPEKTGALTFSSSATTTTLPETNPANNTNITYTAPLTYYANAITPDVNYNNSHCTGTGLTAYFECTLFSGAIATHTSVFQTGGTITIPGQPDYTGSWAVTGNTLTFNYVEISTSDVAIEFSGRGVPGTGCFEGLSRFPDGLGGYSPYVSPYRVCPQ